MEEIKDPEDAFMIYYRVLTSLKQLLHILRLAGNKRIQIDILQELLILLETIEKGRLLEPEEEKE